MEPWSLVCVCGWGVEREKAEIAVSRSNRRLFYVPEGNEEELQNKRMMAREGMGANR